MKNINKKKAFTLAETLITLTILGVVAAITIPAMIQKYIEATNRTKVKKAMAAYEKAIWQMVVENGNSAISSWADGIANNCANTTIFFKKIQGEGCRFKTSDGVWWDITDIEHPIIAFNEEDLDDENATNRFELFAHNENGILRVNDKADELLSDDDKISLEKLYDFVNNEKDKSGGDVLTWTKTTITAEEAAAASYEDDHMCIWNGTTCDPLENNTSTVNAGPMFVSEPFTISDAEAMAACSSSRDGYCESDGGDYQEVARKKCEANGAHLATAAELKAMYKKGQLDSNSCYWAAEADLFDFHRTYTLDTNSGDLLFDDVSINDYKAVCVGN